MNSDSIFNYKEIFGILMFILVMNMVTEKLSPSYAVPINYNRLNSGHLYDNMKRHVDDNAFSNLSRNMTFSAGSGGQALPGNVTSTTNSIGPNFTTGDINNNSPGGTSGSSGSIFTQHGSGNTSGSVDGYQLTVNVPPYAFGTSTVDISITTANGYTNEANVATAHVTSWTFNIPPNQGNWVRVCVNSENSSGENCHTYSTTGTDMSVSLSPVLAIYRGGNHEFGGFSGHHVGGNHGIGDPVDHLH